MIDVSRYFTQDNGDETTIIIEANDRTIHINDNEAIQLIKTLFQSLGDNEQRNIAAMFESWLIARRADTPVADDATCAR